MLNLLFYQACIEMRLERRGHSRVPLRRDVGELAAVDDGWPYLYRYK
jgi:hypothetical protein